MQRPDRAAAILVVDLTLVLVGNAIPGPLLPVYRTVWRLGPLATTLIFAIYAVGVVAAIVLGGRLADEIGPRPVVVATLAIAACSAVIALIAPTVGWLYLARIVQGAAAGLVGGAVTAAVTQVKRDPTAAARWTGIGTTGGIACGLLLAGAVTQVMGHALTWVWVIYLGLLATAMAATASLAGAWTLRGHPRLAITWPGLPEHDLSAFLRAIAGGSLAFACMGLLAGLGPSLALAIGIHSPLEDAGVAALAYVVSGTTLLTVGRRVRSAVPGLLVLLAGLGPLLAAVHTASAAWLLAAAALLGLGNGLTFRITLDTANRLAPAHRRAEIVSTYNIAMYGGIVAALMVTAIVADASSLRRATAVVAGAIAVGVIVLALLERLSRSPRPGPHIALINQPLSTQEKNNG